MVDRAVSHSTGQWLNTMGTAANGNVLSKHEWRDGWAVRYGKEPKDLPKQCDAPGCSKQYSIEHALNCPRGGMVIRRHNEVADEWAALCKLYYATSYMPGAPSLRANTRADSPMHPSVDTIEGTKS